MMIWSIQVFKNKCVPMIKMYFMFEAICRSPKVIGNKYSVFLLCSSTSMG